MERKFIDIHRS